MTRYALHPQVGLRDEAFGALAYHYGNRKLTFLNDDRLVVTLRHLADSPTLQAAMRKAGVSDEESSSYLAALAKLHAAGVIRTCA